MDAPKRRKYFVNHKEAVTIKCPACGRIETFSVARFMHRKHSIKVGCACTETFDIDLEFRRDYRTKTNISANFRALSTPKSRARQCTIADQSSGGLLLQIPERLPIKKDDRLIVSYRPDSSFTQEIERIITVRHYDLGHRLGGAFLDAPVGEEYVSGASRPALPANSRRLRTIRSSDIDSPGPR